MPFDGTMIQRFACRIGLRQLRRAGDENAAEVLANAEMFDEFVEEMAIRYGEYKATHAGGPLQDFAEWIKEFIANNPELIAAILKVLAMMFLGRPTT